MTDETLRLSLDVDPVLCAIDQLGSLLPELAERVPEVFERLVHLIETAPELFVVEFDDGPAAFASELRMRAKPSDGLAMLVAALRARNIDCVIIERAFGHTETSSQPIISSAFSNAETAAPSA